MVDSLEQRYPQFDGLNLCFETREGILKHCSRANAERLERDEPGGVAQRFLHGAQPSLEAQLVNLADEMAYNAHDIDDGVRSGLITAEQLAEVPLYRRFRDEALAAHPGARAGHGAASAVRQHPAHAGGAGGRPDRHDASGAVAARSRPMPRRCAASPPLVAFSAPMRQAGADMKRFLFGALYRHAQVQQNTERARRVVRELFAAYVRQPGEMPDDYAAQPRRERAVADYIAGMTDRFALREHQRLTGQVLFADAA